MAGSRGGRSPPILTLLDAIEAHRGAFEYDWRTRFHADLWAFGWGESWRLYCELLRDPSSHVAAAVSGWQYPASREALTLADLFDVFLRSRRLRGKPKPYPRPWDEPSKRFGSGRRSVDDWKRFKDRKLAEFRRRRDG